ncbi:MAG TPA: outer membrane beta-barrel protein, partial [Gemmatimonadaceae bacterium]|nr:outer membrane beta-barrel protein [Gemmatimonadaceae bacterium]
MMQERIAAARVPVPPSRAGPSRTIRLSLAMLALAVAPNAGAAQTTNLQRTDSIAASVARTDAAKTTDSAAVTKAAALPKWFDEIAVNAFVSSAYQYNSNRPATGVNSYRVFDFNDNSFNLDVAEVVVQIAPSKPNDAGFRVDIDAGNSIPQISKSQDQTVAQFDLQQVFASYIAPLGSGLRFDVGKYVTHLGYEVIEGYDGYNDNYSRSILFGYAIPFTHTGVKASYAFSSKV